VKIFRVMLAAILFAACVFLATANMHDVELFFPELPVAGWPQLRQAHAPLFVVVLGALVAGVVITGLATLFEQLRLRAGARRARKEHARAGAAREAAERERETAERERDVARAELLQVRAEAADLRRERDALRGELERARASEPAARDVAVAAYSSGGGTSDEPA